MIKTITLKSKLTLTTIVKQAFYSAFKMLQIKKHKYLNMDEIVYKIGY